MFGIPARPVRSQTVYDDSKHTPADRLVPAVLGQFGADALHGRHNNGSQRRLHGGAGAVLHRRDNGAATTGRSVVHRRRLPEHRRHAGVLHRRAYQLADDGVPQRARTYTHLPHTIAGNRIRYIIHTKNHSVLYVTITITEADTDYQ